MNTKINILLAADARTAGEICQILGSLNTHLQVVDCTKSITAHIDQGPFNFIFASADREKIDRQTLEKCDLAGVRTVLIVRNSEDYAYAQELGVADILHKPFTQDAFVQLLGVKSTAPKPADISQIIEKAGGEKAGGEKARKKAGGDKLNSKQKGKIVCVWGPHGSPGRSTIASALALALKNKGKSTILIDADTYGGSISSMLGISDEASAFLAASRLSDEGKLNEQELSKLFAYAAHDKLCVLSGIGNPFRWVEFSHKGVRGLLEVCRFMAEYVVIDVGFCLEVLDHYAFDCDIPQRNMPTTVCLEEADICVSICDASAVGVARFLRHRTQLLEILNPGCRVFTIANKINKGHRDLDPLAFYNLLKRFAHIDKVYECCFDLRTCLRALSMSLPVVTAAPNSKLAGQIRTLAADLCGE